MARGKRLLTVAALVIGVGLCISAAATGGFSFDRDPGARAGAVIVDETVQAPELIEKVQPVYPEEMRAGRIEGKVLLQAVIDEVGKVVDVEILRSSRQDALDIAASDAVRQWRYKPAQKDGQAVKVLFTVVVHFALDADAPHEPV